MEMKADELQGGLKALLEKLKANPNDAEAMGELYDRANDYDRDAVGKKLVICPI
jgi:hypothetical protein